MIRAQILSLALVISMTVSAAYAEEVVQASTLKRTHAVSPTWPESATGVEGWVRLRFTVLPNGTVTDVVVEEAEPASVFEAAAVEALRQWTFEPVERNGEKIAQRAEIRMKFALHN